VTSRSSNKASRGSNGSLHESYQISTSSAGNSSRVTKLASNGSSNSSFAVVSTKSMNVNEYTTAICSKEEIKESINIYRSGKLRESLVNKYQLEYLVMLLTWFRHISCLILSDCWKFTTSSQTISRRKQESKWRQAISETAARFLEISSNSEDSLKWDFP